MSKKEKRALHCWHDGLTILEWLEANPDRDIEEYVGSTCMLEKGHSGPHEFTPDDCIGIAFAPAKAQP